MKSKRISPYLYILPAVVWLLLVIYYPIINVLLMSFSKVDMIGRIKQFGFLGNFVKVFKDPNFFDIIKNTFIWTIGGVALTYIISLFIAILLNQNFKGRTIFRIIILIPWTMPLAIIGYVWAFAYNSQYGLINHFLIQTGFIDRSIGFLADTNLVLPSLIVVAIWASIPFVTISILSGLQGIPEEIYDATKIDGASLIGAMIRVILPMMKEVLIIVSVVFTILMFNSFAVIYVMTYGGPGVSSSIIITYIWKKAFESNDFGSAAVLSIISLIILMVFSIIYVKTINISQEGE